MSHRKDGFDKSQRYWTGLLMLSSAFYIFLAWLAYPESFDSLIILMIVFSIACVSIGLWRSSLQKKRIRNALLKFLAQPDPVHEEKLIKILEEPYADAIEKLTAELKKKEQIIEHEQKRSLAYEEFIEAWVHELKTPLSLASLVLTNRQDEMTELVHQRFEHVRYGINESVERILYYARMQSSHSDYCYKPVLLSECIMAVIEELHALIEEKGSQVILKKTDIRVVTDERTLQFILTQIMSNSLKYSNSNQESRIVLEAESLEDGSKYNLKISDNGPGVPAADLPFIFEKGFTGDHPDRKKATGIGLYLVRHFCDEMQIEILTESVAGGGLTITLQFPSVF